jgi:ACR3 family arsenite efflux pump ArsB
MNSIALALVVLIAIPLLIAVIIRDSQRRARTPELDRVLFERERQEEEEE